MPLNNQETVIDYANRNGEEDQEPRSKNKHGAIIVGLIVVLIILLGLFVSVYLTRQQVSFKSKASGAVDSGEISIANSYIFASPLRAKAGNDEKIRVTVFVLDSKGLGVFGKGVELTDVSGLTVTPVQTTTDDLGKTIYDISSGRAGTYSLGAEVEGKALSQKVQITFE